MRIAIFSLFLIFIVNLIFGFGFRFYKFSSFDVILHLGGGFFVAMFFKNYFSVNQLNFKNILLIIGMTTFIGVLWEFIEYGATILFHDYLLNKHNILCCMGNLKDTMGDLATDIAGATLYLAYLRIKTLLE